MPRITSRDLEGAIYKPHGNDEAPEDDLVVYTLLGQEDERDLEGYPILVDEPYVEDGKQYVDPAEERETAYAKKVTTAGKISRKHKYFVKQNTNGKFYNPVGLYGKESQKKSGRDVWVFKEVSKQSFDLYIKFLKLRSFKYLLQAERENT